MPLPGFSLIQDFGWQLFSRRVWSRELRSRRRLLLAFFETRVAVMKFYAAHKGLGERGFQLDEVRLWHSHVLILLRDSPQCAAVLMHVLESIEQVGIDAEAVVDVSQHQMLLYRLEQLNLDMTMIERELAKELESAGVVLRRVAFVDLMPVRLNPSMAEVLGDMSSLVRLMRR